MNVFSLVLVLTFTSLIICQKADYERNFLSTSKIHPFFIAPIHPALSSVIFRIIPTKKVIPVQHNKFKFLTKADNTKPQRNAQLIVQRQPSMKHRVRTFASDKNIPTRGNSILKENFQISIPRSIKHSTPADHSNKRSNTWKKNIGRYSVSKPKTAKKANIKRNFRTIKDDMDDSRFKFPSYYNQHLTSIINSNSSLMKHLMAISEEDDDMQYDLDYDLESDIDDDQSMEESVLSREESNQSNESLNQSEEDYFSREQYLPDFFSQRSDSDESASDELNQGAYIQPRLDYSSMKIKSFRSISHKDTSSFGDRLEKALTRNFANSRVYFRPAMMHSRKKRETPSDISDTLNLVDFLLNNKVNGSTNDDGGVKKSLFKMWHHQYLDK